MNLPIEILNKIYFHSDLDTRINLNRALRLDYIYTKRPKLDKTFLKKFKDKMYLPINRCRFFVKFYCDYPQFSVEKTPSIRFKNYLMFLPNYFSTIRSYKFVLEIYIDRKLMLERFFNKCEETSYEKYVQFIQNSVKKNEMRPMIRNYQECLTINNEIFTRYKNKELILSENDWDEIINPFMITNRTRAQ